MKSPPDLMKAAEDSIRTALQWTEAYVSISFILLISVFIIGIFRRRRRHIVLKFLAWLVYCILLFLIPYTLGFIIQNFFFGGKLLVFLWAVLLVYIYGSVDNFNAVDLDDRRRGSLYFFKDFIQALILTLALVVYHKSLKMIVVVPLILVLVFAGLKVAERTVGLMYSTCSISPLRSCPLLNVKYDDEKEDINDYVQECKYLVGAIATHDNKKIDDRITVEQIWRCHDNGILLSSSRHQDDRLKECCLSFSLFWLLLRRFAGFPPHESFHNDDAWKFVRKGLIGKQEEHELPFRVVEVELSFLYDLFYSKYFCFYQIGIMWQLKQLMFLGVVFWIITLYFADYNPSDDPFRLGIDGLIAKIVVAIVMLLEAVQFAIFITSRWTKVMIICLYINRKSWNKKSLIDCCITKAAQIICCIRLHESFSTWRNELSQTSLLESYSYLQSSLINRLLDAVGLSTGLFFIREGRKESKSIKLSNEVKKAVISSLQKHVSSPCLTNGITSLKESCLPERVLEYLIRVTKLETDIHVILVWHVATTLCEAEIDHDSHSSDYEVATSLSKYCAYLVAFAPELLPGYVATTDDTCSEAIQEAKRLFKDCEKSSLLNKDKIREIAESEDFEVDEGKIVHKGVKLSIFLLSEITDVKKRWEVLAGFWAEMILYLAPNSRNEIAHAEKLGNGGEFITHLWVLLYHAGIVDRSFASNGNF